jgi:plasmid rolling circle replication initiator protein Rep
MGICSTLLGFRETAPDEWSEIRHQLASKHSCHVRHCPIFIQARAWHHTKRASERLPSIVAAHPDARWLFLTLTVKNPKMENPREKLNEMIKAWERFKELQNFPASGWLRATEVTKGQDSNPHAIAMF